MPDELIDADTMARLSAIYNREFPDHIGNPPPPLTEGPHTFGRGRLPERAGSEGPWGSLPLPTGPTPAPAPHGSEFIDQELARRLAEAMRTSPAALATAPPEYEFSFGVPPSYGGRGERRDPSLSELEWERSLGYLPPTAWEAMGDVGTSREWQKNPMRHSEPVDPLAAIRQGSGNWPMWGYRPSPEAYRNLAGDEPMPGERLPPAPLPAVEPGIRAELRDYREPTTAFQPPRPLPDPGRAARVEQLIRDMEEQAAVEARLRAMGR